MSEFRKDFTFRPVADRPNIYWASDEDRAEELIVRFNDAGEVEKARMVTDGTPLDLLVSDIDVKASSNGGVRTHTLLTYADGRRALHVFHVPTVNRTTGESFIAAWGNRAQGLSAAAWTAVQDF